MSNNHWQNLHKEHEPQIQHYGTSYWIVDGKDTTMSFKGWRLCLSELPGVFFVSSQLTRFSHDISSCFPRYDWNPTSSTAGRLYSCFCSHGGSSTKSIDNRCCYKVGVMYHTETVRPPHSLAQSHTNDRAPKRDMTGEPNAKLTCASFLLDSNPPSNEECLQLAVASGQTVSPGRSL